MFEPKVIDYGDYPVDVVRIRNYLRIPYLYTPDDNFDASDPSTFYNNAEYLEDRNVDEELYHIASQAAEFIANKTGVYLGNTKVSFKFTDGVSKVFQSPINKITSITIDGKYVVPVYGDPSDPSIVPISYERNADYSIDFGSFNTCEVDVLFGFEAWRDLRYRKGNIFDEYKGTEIELISKADGVPYMHGGSSHHIPLMIQRLWEVLIDHFYQHRGLVVVGTIVAKIPTSFDAIVDAVRSIGAFNTSSRKILYQP